MNKLYFLRNRKGFLCQIFKQLNFISILKARPLRSQTYPSFSSEITFCANFPNPVLIPYTTVKISTQYRWKLFLLANCVRPICKTYPGTWAYGKEKIRGAERNLPDFFGLCSRCQEKFSGETFQNCCRRRGGGGSDYEKFLLDSIFPTKLTEFPIKLTEFVPFIFIISQYCPTVKRILPDWLCLPNKPWGGGGGGELS